ncbi:c-type cytochrome [Phycisphaeraceae bacterium D3-23]
MFLRIDLPMPSYLTHTLSKHKWLFAVAIVVGGAGAAAVWTWGVKRPPGDPFVETYSEAGLAERIERGAAVFAEHNCAECHATTRDAAAQGGVGFKGPPLVGIVGQRVMLEDESTVERDHRYLRRAIQDSDAQVVKGYRFQPMLDYGFLDDDDVDALLLYVRSLGEGASGDVSLGE